MWRLNVMGRNVKEQYCVGDEDNNIDVLQNWSDKNHILNKRALFLTWHLSVT